MLLEHFCKGRTLHVGSAAGGHAGLVARTARRGVSGKEALAPPAGGKKAHGGRASGSVFKARVRFLQEGKMAKATSRTTLQQSGAQRFRNPQKSPLVFPRKLPNLIFT